jgi:hypothetical protein
VVAGLEVVHARAERLDHAGGFVAQHHRQRPWPVAVDHRQVRVAQAGGLDPHQHFAGAGGVELDRLDRQRPRLRVRRRQAHGPEDGSAGFHAVILAP